MIRMRMVFQDGLQCHHDRNASGNYIFTGVEPGFYVVVEDNPFYHSNISDYDHTTTPPDTDGNDSAQGPDDNIPGKITSG